MLTYSLPPYQTASGAVDILSHTYMRYFSNYPSYLGDRFGEAAMKTVVTYAPVALAKPNDYEARAELLLSGSLSHCDLMMVGRPEKSAGGEHALESQLSGYYDTAHGAGLAVMMPALLKYFVLHGTQEHISRVAQFAISVFGISPDSGDINQIANAGILKFLEWLKELNMPTTLSELGIPSEEIPEAVARCIAVRGGSIDGFMQLDAAAIEEVFMIALSS